MFTIIIGCGRLGSNLAKQLSNEGQDVCIIDRDSEKLNVLGTGFNGLRLKGIEFDNDKLIEAGIEQADSLLAVSSDDNINITVCMIAERIYHVPNVVARVNEPGKKYIYEKLGIKTINPINIGISMLKRMLTVSDLNVLCDVDSEFEIIDIIYSKEKQTTVSSIENSCNCIISGIIHDKNTILPTKDQIVGWGDKIICTIQKNNKKKLLNSLAKGMIL